MATATKPTINPTERREAAARIFLAAKEAADAAAAALEEARQVFLRTVPDEGVLTVDGAKISIAQAERRTFDVDALADLVPTEVFASVTEAKVNTKAFDAFTMTGDITDEVVDAVVTVVPTTTVRVSS